MDLYPRNMGWIEVVCGPMFSGKTEELIQRLRRALYAKQKVQVFKPAIDTRYAELELVSHSKMRLEAIPVSDASEILEKVDEDTNVVGIDEAQFFERNLVQVAQELADGGMRVVLAGLDQDYRGIPFEPIPELMAVAESVTKKLSICMVCGNPASRSYRVMRERERVMLGATESYEARCRTCHKKPTETASEQARLSFM